MSTEENKPEESTITADACKEPKEPKAPDKICPTCIPNESYTEPDWWDEVAPFLNERTCEYWANVSINSDGEVYTLSDMRGKSEAEFRKVLKSYIRSGIRKMLRHYDKLEADEIVCGAPPQRLGFGKCKDISSVDYEEWIDETKKSVIVGNLPGSVYENYQTKQEAEVSFEAQTERAKRALNPFSDVITNTRALELYARAADYWVYSSGESVLHVLITIPAFVFDQVPDAPKKEVVSTGREEVELNAFKLRTQLAMVKRTFSYFSKFQSYFYQFEGGSLKQEVVGADDNIEYKTIYLKYMDDRLDLFEDHLETLIEENGYTWRTWTFGSNKVTHIKIVFNKENERRPYAIDKVLVKAKGCDYVEMRKGIETFKSRDVVRGQTIAGYIANIKEMSKELEGRETPPWLDWVVKYTYPEISVDYGISNLTTDPIGACALKQLEKLDDFILDSVLSFEAAFAYQLNKQNCKMLSDLNLSDPLNPQSGKKEFDESELGWDGEFGVSKSWDKFTEKLENDYTKNTGPFYKWVKKTFKKKKKGSKKKNYFKETISMLDPCRWKDITLDALKCVMAGMDIKTVYLTFVKKTLANLAGEGLEIVLSSLPRDKYEEIMEIVEKEFGNMPMPWEYGYKPGQIPEKLLDSKAREKTTEIVDQMATATEKQSEVDRIKARLNELGIDINAEIADSDLSWYNQRKADKLEKEIQDEYDETTKENMEDYYAEGATQEDREELLKYQGVVDELYGQDMLEADNIETAFQEEQAMKINWTKEKYDPVFAITDIAMAREAKGIIEEWLWTDRDYRAAEEKVKRQVEVVTEAGKSVPKQGEEADSSAGTIDDENTRNKWINQTIDMGTFLKPTKKSEDFFKILEFGEIKDKGWQITKMLWEASEQKIEDHGKKGKKRALTLIWSGKKNDKLRTKVRPDLCEGYTNFFRDQFLKKEKAFDTKAAQVDFKRSQDELIKLQEVMELVEDRLDAIPHVNAEAIKKRQLEAEPFGLFDGEITEEYSKYISLDSLKSALKEEIMQARIILTNNNKMIHKTDKMLEDNIDYIEWKSLTDEQREEVIEKQKDLIASGIYTLEPGETVVPGTLGKALGNVQKALVAVMIDAILKTSTVRQIIRAFDNLPGSKLIKAFLTTFKCPNTHLLWPPIDTFLETLTYDPCGSGNTGMALPKVPKLGKIKGWTIWSALRKALVYALKLTVEQVLMSILMKMAKILDSALCKAMGLPFAMVQNALSPDPKSFGEIVDELICGKKNQNDKEKDDALAKVMKQAGAIPRSTAPPVASSPDNIAPAVRGSDIVGGAPPAAVGKGERDEYSNTNPNWQDMDIGDEQENLGKYKDLSVLISNVATKDELINAMTSLPEEQDVGFMENISNVVKAKLPEFAEAFAGVEETIAFFTGCGNLFTPQQRAALRNQTGQPFADYPIDASTCLTSAEKDQWDDERKKAFEAAGMPNVIASEYVDKLNFRTNSDFADIVDSLIKAPEEQFQEALDKALNPASDPDCSLGGIFDPYPGPTLDVMKGITEGLFKRVQMAFVEDLLAYNFFERWFGDPPGILNTILADKYGFTLTLHNFISGNKFWRFMFTQQWTSDPIPTPETVAIVLKENLENLSDVYKYPYDKNQILHLKDEESLLMEYDNGLETNPFKSKIFMYEAIEKSKKNGEFRQNFDYKLKIRSKFFNKTFVVDKQMSLAEEELLTQIQPETYIGSDYKAKVFYNFIKYKYHHADVQLSISNTTKAFYAMNELIFNDFAKKLMVGKNGDMPEGFYYGIEDVQLTSDDTEYVGPNGEDYDYDEEDMVLGKSKTDNPRVHFLDPAVYGGTYADPYKYIESVGECSGQRGWMKLARVIIPELQCGEGETDFLYLNNLMLRIGKVRDTIEKHEHLDFDPECVTERAFDKIAGQETLSQLEGVVLATIRLHITDFVINAMPVLSNINLDFGKNYDEAISEYIMYKLEQACREERSIWSRSKWEGENYYMLFLEQTAQTVMRMIDNEEMERNEELDKAYKQIEQAIRTYPSVNLDDIDDGWVDGATMMSGISAGGALMIALVMASGPVGAAIFASVGGGVALGSGFLFKFVKNAITLSMARWAMKISVIRENKSACRTMLKYLIRNQLSFYRDEINKRMEPRPHIYDTAKYFIGASNVFSAENFTNAGTSDIENPIGGGQVGNITYGNVKDVVPDTTINPLSFQSVDSNFTTIASTNGAFYLEKYVRVLTPDAAMLNQSAGKLSDLQDAVLNRGDMLRGVVNIDQFKGFLKNLQQIVEDTNSPNISDVLGDMAFRDVVRTGDEETEKMSDEEFGMVDDVSLTGVKFGVRLCYVPPAGFTMENIRSTEYTRLEKSYYFENQREYPATKYIFPVCSYELNLPNGRIQDYIDSDENMNQNIKCFVDNLTKQPEFTLLFDKVFDIKKLPSILAIYSAINFLPSLGLGSEERNEEESIGDDGIGNTFNDTKAALRRLFVQCYKRDDFDPPDEDDEYDFVKDETRRALNNMFRSVTFEDEVWWWQKRRLLDKPFDCDGNTCGNAFSKLFEVKEKSNYETEKREADNKKREEEKKEQQ